MISVLLTIKDRQDYLDRQIEVLLSHLPLLDRPWEIVVYDDGSTTELCLRSDIENVRLVRGEVNVGLIEARNILARLSSPESNYLFFLDDDIFIYNLVGFIQAAVWEINNGYSCVSAPYINLPAQKYERISTFKHVLDVKRSDEDAAFFFGGTSIFDRSTFFRVGGLEGNYYFYLEEEDLALRMYMLGLKMKIMYGGNYLAIHDQASNKDSARRREYLLSNRFLFHYKFVNNAVVRAALNGLYIAVYVVKFRSPSLLRRAIVRYATLKGAFVRQKVGVLVLIRFLVKRYLNA